MALPQHQIDDLRQDEGALRGLRDYLCAQEFVLADIARILELEESPEEILTDPATLSFLYGDVLDEEDSVLGVLARLFLFGRRVPRPAFEAAVGRDVSLFERNGLIRSCDGDVAGEVAIVEYDGRYLVSDPLFFIGEEGEVIVNQADYHVVWPITTWSIHLYKNLVRDEQLRTLLEVGSGSGGVSILARPRYSRVRGFDLNPRAVSFSALNAALNEMPEVEYFVADCLEFADGRKNDHVVAAFPSGPSASGERTTLVASGGSQLGHEFALRFLRERAMDLVPPGGCCQVWVVLAVEERFDSISALLEHEVEPAGRFELSTTVLRSGGTYISREHIARKALPPVCHYVQGHKRQEFLDFLHAKRIVEVAPTLITARVTS